MFCNKVSNKNNRVIYKGFFDEKKLRSWNKMKLKMKCLKFEWNLQYLTDFDTSSICIVVIYLCDNSDSEKFHCDNAAYFKTIANFLKLVEFLREARFTFFKNRCIEAECCEKASDKKRIWVMREKERKIERWIGESWIEFWRFVNSSEST